MAKGIYTIEDARLAARRRIPRLVFDFIDGAAGNEYLGSLNAANIDQVRLLPRVLINVDECSLEKSFLGTSWGLPIGIAPMGMCNLTWPNADRMLAGAATKHRIPLCLSTAASTNMEQISGLCGVNAWFQLYVGQSEQAAMELVDRADRAGYPALVLTVDVPQVAPRPRDLRNGFETPFRFGLRQIADFALHPAWTVSTLAQGAPRTANFPADHGAGSFVRNESRGRVDWEFLDRLRDRWPRKLIIKGVMSAEDAVRIRNSGADAIYVSNHGGRQMDSAPAAIGMLPLIRRALGDNYPLLFDSGVRNGEGVIKALALGADFVMLGRPYLYGIGAGGAQGLEAVINLLASQISLTLAQIGRPDIEQVDGSVLVDADGGSAANSRPELKIMGKVK